MFIHSVWSWYFCQTDSFSLSVPFNQPPQIIHFFPHWLSTSLASVFRRKVREFWSSFFLSYCSTLFPISCNFDENFLICFFFWPYCAIFFFFKCSQASSRISPGVQLFACGCWHHLHMLCLFFASGTNLQQVLGLSLFFRCCRPIYILVILLKLSSH